MLHLYLALHTGIPDWLLSPVWFRATSRVLGHFIREHQAVGLFLVVFAEELGIPLPAPGDVAIMLGGYLTARGAMSLPAAYAAVIVGATLGSTCLYILSRRFGHPFVVRFGKYVGLHEERLDRAERAFRRWGPWAIVIGRHVPGMRIVLSAFSGIFEVQARVFVPCVMISSAAWAAIFLTVGRELGPKSLVLFRLLPVHLVPPVVFLLVLAAAAWLAYERGWRARVASRDSRRAEAGEGPRVRPGHQPPLMPPPAKK